MAKPRKTARRAKAERLPKGSAAKLEFERTLWQAADKLRNSPDAADYKHVVLGFTSGEKHATPKTERKSDAEREPVARTALCKKSKERAEGVQS